MTAAMRKNPTVVSGRPDKWGLITGTRREARFVSSRNGFEEPEFIEFVPAGTKNLTVAKTINTVAVGYTAPPDAGIVPAVLQRTAVSQIVLAASTPPNCNGQIASLATLKQELRGQRGSWRLDGINRRQQDGQLNVDIIRGSF